MIIRLSRNCTLRKICRIPCKVPVGIDSTSEPKWIARRISTDACVVVPEVVVMPPGLLIKILPRKSQVRRDGVPIPIGIFKFDCLSKGLSIPEPHCLVVNISAASQCAKMIRSRLRYTTRQTKQANKQESGNTTNYCKFSPEFEIRYR